jgi:hypothetical protein
MYTPLGTTGNYSANANLRTLQFTATSATLFQPSLPSPAAPWQRLLTVETLQLPMLTSFLHRLSYRTACHVSPPELSIKYSAATANSQLPRSCLFSVILPTANSGDSITFSCRFSTNQWTDSLLSLFSHLRLPTPSIIFRSNQSESQSQSYFTTSGLPPISSS